MGYEIKQFQCNNGRRDYDNKTFRYVFAARSSTNEPCPSYTHHENSVAERIIRTITEKAWVMMIDSQAPIQFWGEAIDTTVYLHQRSPNEGLKRNDRDGYPAWYKTPYKMLHAFGKLTHDAAGNEILYQASLHNLRRFGCYASRLIPDVQRRQGMFGPRSKPCIMVGYTHDLETLWRIWDPEFQKVKAQSEVILDKERNAPMSCQHGSNEIDIFGLREDEEYVKETDTGDELLPGQDSQPTQIGKRSTSHMHEAASDEEAENAHSQRIHRENQTAQHSAADAENIAHSQRLHREDQTAWRSAAGIKKSSQVPPVSPAPAPALPIGSRVTRSQGKASAEAQTASAATGDPYTYAEAMESPQRDYWKIAMEEESTLILLNDTFSTLNSREVRQLQV